MNTRLVEAIKNTAAWLGVKPEDIATSMSYETGGTFNEWQPGPTTQHGQHFGLIQWGAPQRQQYGVYKGMPVEEQVAAAGRYLKDRGVKPGDGLLQIYAAINAGNASKIHASDANNGGAPGTVLDKVNQQMEGHRAKAAALLGGTYTPSTAPSAGPSDRPPAEFGVYSAAPPSMPFTQEEHDSVQGPQPFSSFDEAFWASGNQTTNFLINRFSGGAVDPNDKGWDEDDMKWIVDNIPENYHEYLMTGASQYDRESRLKYVQDDIQLQQRLEAGGTRDTIAGIMSNVFDPFNAAIGAATGGIGAVGRGVGTRILTGALAGGASNAAIDAGLGYGLGDPHSDPVTSFAIGAVLGGVAGPLGRNSATQFEAAEQQRIGSALLNEQFKRTGQALQDSQQAPGVAPAPITGAPSPGPSQGSSAGAAATPELTDPLLDQPFAIRDESVPTAVGGRLRQDVTGQGTTQEKSPLLRMWSYLVGEETVGFRDHSVVPDSVSVKARTLYNKRLGEMHSVHYPAMYEYAKEVGAARGVSQWNLWTRSRLYDEFRQQVYHYVDSPDPPPGVHKAVARAGEAHQKFYDKYANDLLDAGLIDQPLNNPHYIPKMANHERIVDIGTRFGTREVERMIENAIYSVRPEIAPKNAKLIAGAYWRNLQKATYDMEDAFSRSLSWAKKDDFLALLKDLSGEARAMDSQSLDEIWDVFSGLMKKQNDQSGSPSRGMSRLMGRSFLDYRAKYKVRAKDGSLSEMSVNDFFHDDAEYVARRYARQVSGRVEFAKLVVRHPDTDEVLINGFKSENDLDTLIQQIRNEWRDNGIQDKNTRTIDNAIENVKFMWHKINGIPIYGSETKFAQFIRRLKTVEFIRLMSNMGLNQVQETWKLVNTTGMRAALSNVPAIRRVVNEFGQSAPAADRALQELQNLTGLGMEGIGNKYAIKTADDRIGADTHSSLGRAIDSTLDFGHRATEALSLMRALHTFQQNHAMKAVSAHLIRIARKTRNADGSFDMSKLPGKDADRLASVGLTDNVEGRAVLSALAEHGQITGVRLDALNTDKWSPEAVSKFSYLITRYTDRLVQRNDEGGLSKWMSKPMYSLAAQFRSFVFGAWAKSTLYNYHHLDARTMVLVLGEIVAGTATYMLRESVTHGVSESGREKLSEKLEDPSAILRNGIARTATASIIPMVYDSIFMWVPEGVLTAENVPVLGDVDLGGTKFGNARASGMSTDAFLGAPVVSHMEEIRRAVLDAQTSLRDDRQFSQAAARKALRALPIPGNWTPLAGFFSLLIEDLPEKSTDQ